MGVETDIAGLYEKPTWTPKDTSHKQAVRYQSRIIHQIDPIQKELSAALNTLKDATGHFIEYQSLGKLGVTLCRLDPGAKRVLGADKKGQISEAGRRDFEIEINEQFEQCRNRMVEIDSQDSPLQIFGNYQDKIALKLDVFDPALHGERAVIKRYVLNQYPELGKRTSEEDWLEWEPHVTIGRIRYDQLDRAEAGSLLADPFGHLMEVVSDFAERENATRGTEHIPSTVMFPDELSLGGLKVVCDRQEERIF